MSDALGPEEVRFHPIPELPGSQLLSVKGSQKLWKVYHEAYALSGIRQGPGEYYYRRRTRHTPRGGVTLFEPGEVHVTRRVEGPAEFHVLFLAPETMRRVAVELGMEDRDVHLRGVQLNQPDLYRSLRRLAGSIESAVPSLERESRLFGFLRLVLGRAAESPPDAGPVGRESEGVRRARSLLVDRADENVTLGELARESGLSRYHLVREFRREVGMPPHQFHVRVRLARARSLLDQGLPVALAATSAGFTDQSHFHHHFKGVYGVTPGAYLGSDRKNIQDT